MSFKREGDDKNLLGILRQRRIRDLLAVNIPEDEAFLTSNGRLSCLVCYHRPIFDTVEMLLVHRQGKKHAAGVEYQKQQKREVDDLILKRKHEQYIRDGTTNIKQAPEESNHKKFCLGSAYDSRCKKNKVKQPKVKVNLASELKTMPSATSVNQLPGNRNDFQSKTSRREDNNEKCKTSKHSSDYASVQRNPRIPVQNGCHSNQKDKLPSKSSQDGSAYDLILEKQMEGPVLHTHQLKKLFERPRENPMHVTPYQSKKPRIKTDTRQTSNLQYHPYGHSSYSNLNINTVDLESLKNDSLNILPREQDKYVEVQNNTKNINVEQQSAANISAVKKKSKPLEQKVPEQKVNKDQIEKAEKYLHYRGAGWKKDLFGNWIKDEDAEFDSDEEPPDLP